MENNNKTTSKSSKNMQFNTDITQQTPEEKMNRV
jgi:hypothetical protein